MRWIWGLLKDDQAQDLAEYGIALAIISVAVVAIAMAIGGDVNTIWANSQPALQTVIDAEP